LGQAKIIVRGVDPTGCKNNLQHLKLQAYILLCHGAFEEYLESLGLAVATEARRRLKVSGILTKSIVSLVASKLLDDAALASAKKVMSNSVSDLEAFSAEAYNRYRARVTGNNGIVLADQQAILLPIGVDPAAVDVALMNSLHSFGQKRGAVAHSFKVQRQETLADVSTLVAQLSASLSSYDEEACRALKMRMR
jgi:hypothetical protein